MKVKENNSATLTSSLAEAFGHPPRSPGLHASRIIRDLAGRAGKKKADGISEVSLNEYGTMGFVWERVLEQTLAGLTADSSSRYLRLGEKQGTDGICRTTDYADLDYFGDGTGILGIEEWKCRWASYRKADNLEANFWPELTQIKDYCWLYETPYARLRMLFVAGDWRGDVCPKYREWELEFTTRELMETHEMLAGHAKRQGWL